MNLIPALVLVAKKEISGNREITIDYGSTTCLVTNRTKCCCGTKKCRQFIEGMDTKTTGNSGSDFDLVTTVMDKSIRGAIANNPDVKNGYCYFSAAIQFLFRGISKNNFQHLLDKFKVFSLLEEEASNADKVLMVAKEILDGTVLEFNETLRKLAVDTNFDPDATTRTNCRDAYKEHQNFYDTAFTVSTLTDMFFVNCILFQKDMGILEDEQQAVYNESFEAKGDTLVDTDEEDETIDGSKKKQKDRKRKKGEGKDNTGGNKKRRLQKLEKPQKTPKAPKLQMPNSKITDYDLPSILSREIKEVTEITYYKDSAKSGEVSKYFIINVSCLQENRLEKRVNNVIAFHLDGAAKEICGYAIIKSFIYLCDHHYTTYVHDM